MRYVLATLVLATVLSLACGKNAVAPTPATLEGTWRAARAQFVSVAGSTRQVDIVAQGGAVTLALAGSNYTFTQTESGKPQTVQTGTWSASADLMTLRPSGVAWTVQYSLTLSGNTLTLDGGSVQFDFTAGSFEEAKLNMTLARQ